MGNHPAQGGWLQYNQSGSRELSQKEIEQLEFEYWQLEQLRLEKEDQSTVGTALKTLDVLNTLGYGMGGMFASAGTVISSPLDRSKWRAYGLKWKISPSEGLGVTKKDTELLSARGLFGLGLDIILDPGTYISGGTGGAIKLASVGASKIALSKTGVKELGKFIAKYGDELGSLEFVHHIEQSADFAKKVKAFEGIGLRGWWLEKELISKETLGAISKLPGMGWESGLRKLALSGEFGLKTASTLKGAEEIAARGAGLTLGKAAQLKTRLEDLLVPFAKLKRLPKSPRRGLMEDTYLDEFLKLQASIRSGTKGIVETGEHLAEQARKAFGKDYEDIVTQTLESPVLRESMKLTPEQMKVVNILESGYKAFALAEKGRGLLQHEMLGYARHFLTAKGRAYLEKGGKLTSELYKPLEARNLFARERKLKGTLAEINKIARRDLGFDLFEPNPVAAFSIRSLENLKAVKIYDFLERVKAKDAVTAAEALRDPSRYADTAIQQLKGHYFPREIAEHLSKAFAPQEISPALKLLEPELKTWKFLQTIPFPAYHAVNIAGASWNAFILGDTQLSRLLTGLKITTGIGKETVYTTALGRKYTAGELAEQVAEHGTTGHSGYMDIQESLNMRLRMPGWRKTIDPFVPWSDRFFMTQFARKTEDVVRTTMYIDRILKGSTQADAAKWALKHQGDYSPEALSEFMKGYPRFLFPFVKWSQFNIPLQVQYLLTQPGKYGAFTKYTQAALGYQDPASYYEGELVLPTGVSGVYKYILFPTTDLFKVMQIPQNLGKLYQQVQEGAPPAEIAHTLDEATLNMFGPLVKIPIEAGTRTNIFTGKKYESWLDLLMTSFIGRPWTTDKGLESDKTTEQKIEQYGLGVKTAMTQQWTETQEEFREAFGLGLETYWTDLDERLYKRGAAWLKADTKYAAEVEGINTLYGMNEATKQKLRYESQRKRNVAIYNRQVGYVRTALYNVRTQMLRRSLELLKLKKIQNPSTETQTWIRNLEHLLRDLKALYDRYSEQKASIEQMRERERNKRFVLPNQLAGSSGEPFLKAMGREGSFNRPGAGPELADGTELKDLADLKAITSGSPESFAACYRLPTSPVPGEPEVSYSYYESEDFRAAVTAAVLSMIESEAPDLINEQITLGI